MYLKYSGLALPRYTSYPAITSWKDTSTIPVIKEQLDATAHDQNAFSLHFHVMNPASPATEELVEKYLHGLEREVTQIAHHVDSCVMQQVHFGGGTPNFLHVKHWRQLYENVLSRFTISEEAEWSVELDPRSVTEEQIRYLHDIGVNRVTFGIQDFDSKVQQAIYRGQTYEKVAEAVEWVRSHGIAFINFDLIYGLPFQTEESLQRTLDQVIQLSPDRIAFCRLEESLETFQDLPTGAALLSLNLLGINRLLAAGYEFIGMDHFAKANDPLAAAARKDQLQRNFLGLTTVGSLPLLGFGPSAISMLDDVYVQNPKGVDQWLGMVEDHEFQRKSHIVTEDDKIRREVINQIFCHGSIDKGYTESFYDIEFDHYFAKELQSLKTLAQDGLVTLDTWNIRLTQPLGLLLRGVVAAHFDVHQPFGRGSQVG
ncbi:oxygen-independent coproporphyrinogen III oxidase [Oligoflexus tunisiensis]|uniref:oxygen-independent coproporphyrinogen III oxidase n=1 Tax=Oligoflexus tunisiensis TaxID=708132 RepID=UPI001C406EC0|nr:oxygen-independent coproporphyrinogen III oxidase [Oligoflexus tunisiensis]